MGHDFCPCAQVCNYTGQLLRKNRGCILYIYKTNRKIWPCIVRLSPAPDMLSYIHYDADLELGTLFLLLIIILNNGVDDYANTEPINIVFINMKIRQPLPRNNVCRVLSKKDFFLGKKGKVIHSFLEKLKVNCILGWICNIGQAES